MRALMLIIAATTASVPIAPAAADSSYGAAQPVSDAVLEAAYGTALPGFSRNARALSDGISQLFLQQVGVGSRIAIDNWWAQTGAALIYDSAISGPISR